VPLNFESFKLNSELSRVDDLIRRENLLFKTPTCAFHTDFLKHLSDFISPYGVFLCREQLCIIHNLKYESTHVDEKSLKVSHNQQLAQLFFVIIKLSVPVRRFQIFKFFVAIYLRVSFSISNQIKCNYTRLQ
jgi:hypothetical protein